MKFSLSFSRFIKLLVCLLVIIESAEYLARAESVRADEENDPAVTVPPHAQHHHHKQHHGYKAKNHKSQRNTRRNLKTTTIEPVPSTTELVKEDASKKEESKQASEYKNIDYVANITAKVGETVILYCAVNSSYGMNPGVIWMQGKLGNVLTLNTNRITVDPRFEIIQQSTPIEPSAGTLVVHKNTNAVVSSHKRQRHNKQQSHHVQQPQSEFTYYQLRISDLQTFDENEYACETTLTTREDDDQPNLHSLIYLQVTQSPSFVETLTSQSDLIALENGNAILKCFAVGKPTPRIRWYKIEEETGQIRDLQHESTSITIKNISKNDLSKYECVAGNGIQPSVSKKFTITVYYSPIVTPIKPVVYQYVQQSAVLGCVVQSNPESTITWYKSVSNVTLIKQYQLISSAASSSSSAQQEDSDEYVQIDILKTRFNIIKHKQLNQTVSYFKIKNVEQGDFGKYKCEVANPVGKTETVIRLMDLKEKEAEEWGKTRPKMRPVRPKSKHHSGQVNDGDTSASIDESPRREGDDDETPSEDFEASSVDYGEYSSSDSRPTGGSKQNIKKKQTKQASRNKTLFKYQINKSDRNIDSENSLQQIDEFYSSASQTHSGALTTTVLIHVLLAFFVISLVQANLLS